MSDLIHRIYASVAVPTFREFQIPSLLEHARAANDARGITRMLLFIERSFFQVLEGAEAAVDTAYESIAHDPRHMRMTQIVLEPITIRSFGEWSMGFSSPPADELGQMVGQNDFFTSADCLLSLTPGRATKLLLAFRDGRWRADITNTNRALG